MPPTRPSRRAVLRLSGAVLLGAGATGTVSGCSGERLRTPWSPDPTGEADTRPSPPDVDLVRQAHARVTAYLQVLGQVSPESSGQRTVVRGLGELWPQQQERLAALLAAVGAPPDTGPAGGDDSAVTTTADDAATTGEAELALIELGRRVRADIPDALAQIAASTPTNRPMLTSLAAQHAVSARRAGADLDWPELVGPTGTAAVPVLAALRPAIFGLEVVAARSTGEERELYESILSPLQALTRSLTTLAGDAAPVPPLGYDLPEPLDSAADRAGLAQALVHDIAPAVLSVVDRAGADVAQVESLVRILVSATLWGSRLDLPAAPFPGMTLP